MNIIPDLRKTIGTLVIRKSLRNVKRKRVVHNYDTAMSAGILFDASRQEHFNSIQAFSADLRKHVNDIRMLGYVKHNQLPNNYLFKKDFVFYQKKDLNWYLRPVKQEISYFVNRPFDILIDLSMSDAYHFQYIVALSPAQLKVGHFIPGRNYYDLMIHIEKNPDIDYFITQVNHYLSIINKPHLEIF